jgi:HSP20 family protein
MTTLVRWSPFAELESLERRMRRMLGEVGFAPTLAPAADVYETKDELVLELEAPGYAEKDLTLEVFDHVVSIKGKRHEAKAAEEEEKTFRLRERLEQEFERRFELPHEVDTKQLKARFHDGVLELHAPKLEVAKPHRIEIARK